MRVVSLTARGREAAEQVETAWAELGEHTAAGLTDDERETLTRLLMRVAASLNDE